MRNIVQVFDRNHENLVHDENDDDNVSMQAEKKRCDVPFFFFLVENGKKFTH